MRNTSLLFATIELILATLWWIHQGGGICSLKFNENGIKDGMEEKKERKKQNKMF